MRLFGLIGYPLSHSFSKKYFTEKFAKEGIADAAYELFELADINQLPAVLKQNPALRGLNVTIPHKLNVVPFLDRIDSAAARIGAVNVVKVHPDGCTTGYNSDYFGFKDSLTTWYQELYRANALTRLQSEQSLILGSGGASKAVQTALYDMGISYQIVSRQGGANLNYEDLTEQNLSDYRLIVNTTPLGMSPDTDACPPLPYHWLNAGHQLYDLVYNPTDTKFMQMGRARGAQVLNGLPMLYAQAEKSWEIWNE